MITLLTNSKVIAVILKTVFIDAMQVSRKLSNPKFIFYLLKREWLTNQPPPFREKRMDSLKALKRSFVPLMDLYSIADLLD